MDMKGVFQETEQGRHKQGEEQRLRGPRVSLSQKDAGWAEALSDAQGCPGILSLESCLGP